MSDSDSDVPAPPPKKQQQTGSSGTEDVPKLQQRIAELETEVTTLQAQLATFKTENEQYKSEIDDLKAQIESLKKEQEELNKQLEQSVHELNQAKSDIEIAKNETLAANAATQQAQAQLKSSQSTTTTSSSSSTTTDSTTTSTTPSESTQDEVEELKSQLEELKQQLRRQEQLLIQSTSPTLTTSSGPSIAGTLQKRKPGEVTLKMRKNREEKLLAVRAQITAWLNKILSPEPPLVNETLMERLATGVLPCNLAIIVDDSAIPILGRVHLKAAAYSILAHENVHSFLRVCYDWGLKKIECFSPEDLLSGNIRNRNERLVVETLLSLAKVCYIKFGIEPPYIIKTEMAIDELENSTNTTQGSMADSEHDKLLEAIRAYCALHGIADIPTGTERKGQFEFSDGTRSHIRMFEIDPENADGNEDRDHGSILEAVQNGELVLLVRHNNNWEELHKFLHDHSGGKKIDLNVVQHSALSQTASSEKGSLVDDTATQAQVVEPVIEAPVVVDVMVDTYGAANYEEEDEDDDEDEEYLAECRRIAELERQRAEQARLATQQAEAELAARKAALAAQQEEEEEFKRNKQKNKYNNSYLTDADLTGDMGELLTKVRSGMGTGDFDPERIDPEKANFSAIINTSDYKRFKDVTMNEIQVMTNDDLERLAEYTAKQEFFFLTALAVKMTHELSYSSAFQVVTNQELWRRAIENNIPFHRFYTFITNEITKSFLEQSALDKQTGSKDGVNLRSHRELMIANIKDRQKQKLNSKRE